MPTASETNYLQNKRQKGCVGKVRHRTLLEALAVRKRMGKKDKGNKRLQPYKCEFCGYYHLGHDDRRTRK